MKVLNKQNKLYVIYFENYIDYSKSILSNFDIIPWNGNKKTSRLLFIKESSLHNCMLASKVSSFGSVSKMFSIVEVSDIPEEIYTRCNSGVKVNRFIEYIGFINRYMKQEMYDKLFSIDYIVKSMSKFIFDNANLNYDYSKFLLVYVGLLHEHFEEKYGECEAVEEFLDFVFSYDNNRWGFKLEEISDITRRYSANLMSLLKSETVDKNVFVANDYVADVSKALLDVCFLDSYQLSTYTGQNSRLELAHLFKDSEKYIVFSIDKLPYLTKFVNYNRAASILCREQDFINGNILAGLICIVYTYSTISFYDEHIIQAKFDMQTWFLASVEWGKTDLKFSCVSNDFIDKFSVFLRYAFAMKFLSFSWKNEFKSRVGRQLYYWSINVDKIVLKFGVRNQYIIAECNYERY